MINGSAGNHLQGAARPGGAPGRRPWFNVVKWTYFALLNAEELGVTQANVDEMKTSANPEIQRFLGVKNADGTAPASARASAFPKNGRPNRQGGGQLR